MDDRETVLGRLIGKVENLPYSLNNIEDHDAKALRAALEEQGGGDELRAAAGLTLAEYHAIDCIGRQEAANATAIARRLGMTRGGISKITAKLVGKRLIEVRRLPDNRKETHYTLTPFGHKVFLAHAKLHAQAAAQLAALFATYSHEELAAADKFLADLTAVFHNTEDEDGQR